ncbi:putative RNA-directed DNA polymerase, eukaryota, reverse transcriptase zinc-binding domain protein [Tanacetum coccineum]|uniref:RNA-directed DNA polymerase, eukaryota, reverse transcriptase zinc-binding domain protein n=1 Tax=Tanacetum coccineum TaxID=301880 RepID=A0ABQ4XUY5_9ASTR
MGVSHRSELSNTKFKNLRDVSSTIYISNFPFTVGTKDLFQLCAWHARVVDVYIAYKLSKIGKRFGFVRFIKMENQQKLLENLNQIWIGSYKLFASMARFEKKTPVQRTQSVNCGPCPYRVNNKGGYETQANGSRSYAATLKGKLDPNKENTTKAACFKKVTLHESDLLNIVDSRCVVLVKIHSVSNSFMVDERIVWLEIEGLPLCAWTTKAFKKVANAWGKPVFIDDDPTENMAIGRVCVKTKLKGTISEVCSVTIQNVSYNVRVKEFTGWVPSLEAVDDSIKDMESEDSENDEIKSSIPDMEPHEEGEIHEKVNEPFESQLAKESNSPNEDEKDIEANTTNDETEPTWADEVFKMQKEEEKQNTVYENQSNSLHNASYENGDIVATSSPSKPPGFGRIQFQSPKLSQGKSKEGCHSSTNSNRNATSANSNKNATRSQNGKSHKSFRATGSLIDAFISHIKMGSVLGYDMEGSKADLKKFIDNIGANEGNYFIFGDFNVVRYASERIGSSFNSRSSNDFNQFLNEGSLYDLPLGGHAFTRISSDGEKLSRLDRFLITDNLATILPNIYATAMDRMISDHRAITLQHSLIDFDAETILEAGGGDQVLRKNRQDSLTKLRQLENDDRLDAMQKAKVKWGVEADENSKFFHGIVNRKRRQLAINGIMKEGIKVLRRSESYNSLNAHQSSILEEPVSEVEIKKSIWDCGSDKYPVANPLVVSDFRPISLIGAQYKIIAKILANRLSRVIETVISSEQTAFVSQRQILDGPLMVNEIIDWYKRKKAKLMILKIDFEKAFDSVSWDFLDQVLQFTVNGSPTAEFDLQRGLRQGDPLSPFLFILVMEVLHVAIEDAINAGLFYGAKLHSLHVSHLFFMDDVLLLGEWSSVNISNLVNLLNCFYKVSGLKHNLHKSNLFGIGVDPSEVSNSALVTGCQAQCLPFSYLGLPIGSNMARVNSWVPIVNKFNNRLSRWKSSLLSIGGRSTLISSVLGSLEIYFLSIFPMPTQVNNSLEKIRSNFFWGSTEEAVKIP